jgi:anaerobic selenocysteine-containing dehydrogenase
LFESDAEILARLLDQSGTGLDFDELKLRGTVWPDPAPGPHFPNLRFSTPTGRIELASAAAADAGQPRLPLPLADPRPADGRLRLLSPSSEWMLNTTYGNDGRVGRRAGGFVVTLNPGDAAARGLGAGGLARVANGTGELCLPVALSDDVPPSVALLPKGRWPKLEAAGGNVNVLNPGLRSDLGDSSAVHGTEVTVEAAPQRISPAPA